jgi:hypothetical protein
MKPSRRSRLFLGAILTALPAIAVAGWTAPAMAQYRVGDDGRANDANNRLGSGGYNNSRNVDQRSAALSNSQIYYGNTTGLNFFHGDVQGFDPYTVNSNTETRASDRFNAIAGPVNYTNRVTGSPQENTGVPFYSTANLAVPPPEAVTQTANGVGLIPAPKITQQPNDMRLGLINSVTNQNYLPAPGELDLPGPVDASGNPTILTASPLYGVKAWSATDASDAYFLSKYTNVRPEAPGDHTKLDNATIQQMRNELNGTMVNPNGQPLEKPTTPGQPGSNANQPGQPQTPGATNLSQSQQLGQPAEAPSNPSMSAQSMNSNIAHQALGGNLQTDQGVQQRLLVPPAQQSTQLAELEKRLAQSKTKMSPQQATEAYNQEVRLKQEAEKENATTPGQAAPGIAGASGTPGGATALANKKPLVTDYAGPSENILKNANKPLNPMIQGPLTKNNQPFVITSLATGIKSKGLAGLLKSAEDQMRQGKFTAALDTYDAAQQVAPNNPFITLGRGFAELGASYYGKAEGDLRRSFLAEPAVLIGQYDLKGFLGEDRLGFVQKDLKSIYDSEKTERPAFLLAYISHNLGDDTQAGKYLDAALQRAGGQDAVVNLMRNAWGLPSGK